MSAEPQSPATAGPAGEAEPPAAFEARRVNVPVVEPVADSNIRRRYAIESASWIWHPQCAVDEPAILRFTNCFKLDEAATVRLHVSADQRYELRLDGRYIGMGPDRSDLLHWSFASYELHLQAGEHQLEAMVWWLGEAAPRAQVSLRGGFICAADGCESQLNTGTGPWRIQRLAGWSLEKKDMEAFHVIGDAFVIDGAQWHAPPPAVAPSVVFAPLEDSRTGNVRGRWHLHPSPLPDMLRRSIRPGRVRAAYHNDDDIVAPAAARTADVEQWQRLLTERQPLQVPANTTVRVIWDLEDYYCGFAQLLLSGGAGSDVSFEWAESLYEVDEQDRRTRRKGDRDQVEGKMFFGFGDRFLNGGGEQRAYQGQWWRSGRYVRLTVRTTDEPLRVEQMAVLETRYPWEDRSQWGSDDAGLSPITKLAVRGLQACMHETYMDCPYYEQMMYVGDTRIQMLVGYVCNADRRLARRSIELFDWSRWRTGFVAERYPSEPFQLSLTFAMLWVAMVRDYAWWCDDAAWVRRRMVGVRCLIEHFLPLLNDDSLLAELPGWSFVDWVPGVWVNGNPPDGGTGVGSVVNLHFVLALHEAAALERAYGEPANARRYDELADRVAHAVVSKFWDAASGCLADDPQHAHFSEHAQCLALLTGVLDDDQAAAALRRLITGENMARASVYFSFYLLETFYRSGQGDRLFAQLEPWRRLIAEGLRTPVERDSSGRSDCHAWGSHPLFHFHASLAGIRSDAPGFRRVRIAPLAVGLAHIESTVPHPAGGEVRVVLDFDNARQCCRASVELPPHLPGTFVWGGHEVELAAGKTTAFELESNRDSDTTSAARSASPNARLA
ncbi:MAG: hypothetical protein WD118_08870 [Phycisphaeraceae bacterium]